MEYRINEQYDVLYRDAHGEERAILFNDGHQLRLIVRGIEFTGRMLDDFEPAENGTAADSGAIASFQQRLGCLYGYEIAFEVPLPIVAQSHNADGFLHVRMRVGLPQTPDDGGKETVELALTFDGKTYRSSGRNRGFFEMELLEIQAALPEDVYMRACIHCAFSDYSPYGQGAFGCMLCFRDNKMAYRNVKGKGALFQILNTYTEQVQETYCCPEFERRTPGSGYRG